MAESSGRSRVIYNDTALPCTVLNINEALCIAEVYYPLYSIHKWGLWVIFHRESRTGVVLIPMGAKILKT